MPNIFLVDDDMNILQIMKEIIESAGLSVTTAEHGDDAALRAIEEKKPDIVCCDIQNIPDGFEFMKNLRGGGYTGPIIVITGYWDERTQDMCMTSGATTVVKKPILLDQFLTLIKLLL